MLLFLLRTCVSCVMGDTQMDFLRYTPREVIEVFVMLKNNYFPCFKTLNNYWRLNIYEKDKFHGQLSMKQV